MFKAMLIKWAASAIFDAVVDGLEGASKKSTNKLDNKAVKLVKESKKDIMDMMKTRKRRG